MQLLYGSPILEGSFVLMPFDRIKPFFMAVFLLISHPVTAQVLLSGKVIDERTQQPVPYATVGLKNQNTGINADEQGSFSIQASDVNDSLMIFSLGYIAGGLHISTLTDPRNILIPLQHNDIELPEARITGSRSLKYKKLNEFTPGHIHNFLSSRGYEVQVAQLLDNPRPGARLISVTMALRDEPGLKASFRLRIYEAGDDGKPGKDIYPMEILVHYNNEEPLTVDLQHYNIHIPGRKFFVALEWLKIPSNESIMGADKSYRPIIGFSNKGSRKDQVWRLNYRNEWYQQKKSISKGNLAVMARVRY